MAIDPKLRELLELLFCYDRERVKTVKEEKRLIAHYTTADTAMKIISGRTLWLRNAGVMNDYMEIQYGRSVIEPVLRGQTGKRFFALLDGVKWGLGQRVQRQFAEHCEHARETVFMTSLSEHDQTDALGKLSMWRAYGGPVSGVALLFKGDVVDLELEPSLEISASPVLYGGPERFDAELQKVVKGLEARSDLLKEFEPDHLLSVCGALLQFSMFSIKHPGFAEECEWRFVHRPFEFAAAHVTSQTVTVNGIPQTIYEVPFHNPARGPLYDLPQLNLDEILEGIIIGPCHYPETVFRAFVDAMQSAGITDPERRIRVSNIPLRQQW
ncbi:DUF2971 domain-containing protein [Altererythrobacter sp. Root672]|uniref:DUF2971 domain-containing protein n=1 Tax=Altererythrobacter sp. Root672 TaxID=1736584 RepID=UPI0006FBF5D4|nr:DUF2971 domain-containing protein [Altererythrobacter sp. Root672]KRA83652.1 hypothetical protein ASD76_06365 [Altererythrobacter sp. Root672]